MRKPSNLNRRLSPGQRTFIDLGPLVVFFCANYIYGIMVGTASLMAATAITVIIAILVERKVPPMPLVTCLLVMVFGGLTIYFDDEMFIKVKPTIINLLFAVALLSGLILRKHFLKILLGNVLHLTDDGWRIISQRWMVMFLFLAGMNEILWRTVDTDTWVTFKAFGIPAIVIIFSICMAPLLRRYQLQK